MLSSEVIVGNCYLTKRKDNRTFTIVQIEEKKEKGWRAMDLCSGDNTAWVSNPRRLKSVTTKEKELLLKAFQLLYGDK